MFKHNIYIYSYNTIYIYICMLNSYIYIYRERERDTYSKYVAIYTLLYPICHPNTLQYISTCSTIMREIPIMQSIYTTTTTNDSNY